MGVMRLILALDRRGIVQSFDELAQRPTFDGWWALIQHRRARLRRTADGWHGPCVRLNRIKGILKTTSTDKALCNTCTEP